MALFRKTTWRTPLFRGVEAVFAIFFGLLAVAMATIILTMLIQNFTMNVPDGHNTYQKHTMNNRRKFHVR